MNKAADKIIFASILSALIFIILPLALIMAKYDAWMLISISFGIGFVLRLLLSLTVRYRTKMEIFKASLITLILIALSLFLFAREGAICLIIMGSFLLIPFYLGILFGFLLQRKIWARNALGLLLFCSIISSATVIPKYSKSKMVTDELIINASSAKVWRALIQPISFGKSSNFYFRNGVSYPNSMALETIGNKLYLNCTYNNGRILAPVISYSDNKLFSFHFNDSIITMMEKNLYKESHTMHITHHFEIDFGQFELLPINSVSCKLVASTSFKHKFEPEFYTDLWVKYFVHNIHSHVLESVKTQVERVDEPY